MKNRVYVNITVAVIFLKVVRYDRGGEPLWVSSSNKPVDVPPCPACGQQRQFEFQVWAFKAVSSISLFPSYYFVNLLLFLEYKSVDGLMKNNRSLI